MAMVLLSYLFVLTMLTQAIAQRTMPLFLFSGQSNMEGHSTDIQSASEVLFREIVDILNSNITDVEKEALLEDDINKVSGAIDEVSGFEAGLLIALANRGLMQNIESPMVNAFCSFRQAGTSTPVRFPATNVSPTAGCGREYGHELMFAHSLASGGEPWSTQDFTITKVARDATEIYRDWSSTVGTYWGELNETIHSTSGEWKAFVWHQGESDSFGDDDKSIYYEQNLTAFMSDVREEMYRAGSSYASPSDIPVVIVEVHWPGGEKLDRVVEAQRNFVANDGMAIYVRTDDLARFLHFDAAAYLIIGDRIAQQLAPVLSSGTVPPLATESPSSPPSPAESEVPTTSSAPSNPPTNAPSSAPSYKPSISQEPSYPPSGAPSVSPEPSLAHPMDRLGRRSH